jgi:hypothetical protein
MTVDLSNVHLEVKEDGEVELYIGGYFLSSLLLLELSAEALAEIQKQAIQQNAIIPMDDPDHSCS